MIPPIRRMTDSTARSLLPLALSAVFALVLIVGAGAVALYGTRPGAGKQAHFAFHRSTRS